VKPNTLVSTVGTSLLNPFKNTPLEGAAPAELAEDLRRKDPADRTCGAEINSVADMRARGLVAGDAKLHFCVSDTPSGRRVGAVLAEYFGREGAICEVHAIEGLRDDDTRLFKTVGLRNLARKLGELVRRAGDARFVAINATGGFKAQIAVAVLIGQALGVAVHYKFELFPEIIEFPPMPVSFDFELLGRFADDLCAFEDGEVVARREEDVEPALRVLLEEVPNEDGRSLWALAPIGQIYLEGFRLRHPAARSLPPNADAPAEVRLRDDHFPDGFREYLERVCRENRFVTRCHTIPYEGQRAIRDRSFRVRDGEIVAEYVDRSGFGARAAMLTTAKRPVELAVAAQFLNERYGRS